MKTGTDAAVVALRETGAAEGPILMNHPSFGCVRVTEDDRLELLGDDGAVLEEDAPGFKARLDRLMQFWRIGPYE